MRRRVRKFNPIRLLVLLLMFGYGFGQAVHDLGVDHEIDEFTRETSCRQAVATWDLSLMVVASAHSDEGTFVSLTRLYAGYDSVFNLFGERNATVYFRFPNDEVLQVTAGLAQSDIDSGRERDTAIIMNEPLLYRILSSPGDIRIRFDGSKGREDFTLPHEVVLKLAAGFGNECI